MSSKSISYSVFTISLLWLACSSPEQSPCQRDVESESYLAAARTCSRAFESNGRTSDGVLAVRALQELQRYQKVVEMTRRLKLEPAAAAAWRATAKAHQALKQDQEMVAAHRQARDLWVDAQEPGQAAYEMHRLWYYYHTHSNLLESLNAATDALQLARRSQDDQMKIASFTNVLSSLSEIGEVHAARVLLKQAPEFLDTKSASIRFYLHFYEGQLFYSERRFALARSSYQRAVALADSVSDTNTLFAARYNIADTCLELGCLQRASKELQIIAAALGPTKSKSNTAFVFYQAHLELKRGHPQRTHAALQPFLNGELVSDWRWEFELLDGKALEKLGDEQGALRAYNAAAATVESLRASMGYNDFKAVVLSKKREPLERLFALHAKHKRASEALATSEQARARSFIDAFVSNATQDSQKERSHSALRHRALRTLIPNLSQSSLVSTVPLKEALAAQGSAMLLSYFETKDAVWLHTAFDGTVSLFRLSLGPDALKEAIEAFDADRDSLPLLSKLGSALLPDKVLDQINRVQKLHIVADGPLGRVPFSALRVRSRYLIENHTISYIPSLSAMHTLRSKEERPHESSVIMAASAPGGVLRELPGAKEEAIAVASAIQSQALVGHAATKAALASAANAQLLHVSAHSGLSDQGAWLQLADGVLYASELFDMQLHPKTVVLASCVSASRHGRGMWGTLGASFLASGSRAVVASIWPVADTESAKQILAFYAEDGAHHPVDALAKAQRRSIQSGLPPSQWAGMVVLGDSL